MGRPKGSKNKPKVIEDIKIQETENPELNNIPINSKAKKLDSFICDRCHKEVGRLISINLVQLTGLANYYRASKNDKLSLCPECVNKFNKVLDSFLYNNGKGVEKKPWSLSPDEYKEPIEFKEGIKVELAVNTKAEITNKEDEDFDF